MQTHVKDTTKKAKSENKSLPEKTLMTAGKKIYVMKEWPDLNTGRGKPSQGTHDFEKSRQRIFQKNDFSSQSGKAFLAFPVMSAFHIATL